MSFRRSRPATPPSLQLAAGLSLAGLVLAGCGAGRRVPSHMETPGWLVDVSVQLDAETSARRLEGGGLGAGGGDLAIDALIGPVESFGVDLELVLELSPSRRFRDGSVGWQVDFRQARATVRRPGEADVAVDDVGLQGRAVELRTFGDGEILVVDQAAEIAGADRMGDVLDVLWPLLSPAPPSLDSGESQPGTVRWPLMAGPQRGWRHTLGATWHNDGQDEAGRWHLRYDGPVSVKGQDRATMPWIGVRGSGQAAGEITLGDVADVPVAARLDHHAMRLERTVEIEYPHAEGGALRVEQVQRYTLEASRRAP